MESAGYDTSTDALEGWVYEEPFFRKGRAYVYCNGSWVWDDNPQYKPSGERTKELAMRKASKWLKFDPKNMIEDEENDN